MLVSEVSKKQILKISTKSGKPAKVDGKPVYAVDEKLASLAIAEDGLSFVLTALAAGIAVVTVTADADLGEGVKAITCNKAFEILEDSEAASMVIEEELEATPAA